MRNRRARPILVRGRCACPGVATGRAVLITNPTKSLRVEEGAILVAEFTTPILATALGRCAGLVLARGGLTAHGAVIAREFGTPCIVGAYGALERIKGGERIRLNATRGAVYAINSHS